MSLRLLEEGREPPQLMRSSIGTEMDEYTGRGLRGDRFDSRSELAIVAGSAPAQEVREGRSDEDDLRSRVERHITGHVFSNMFQART